MYNTKDNPLVEDIGKDWRNELGLKRYNGKNSAFVRWHKRSS